MAAIAQRVVDAGEQQKVSTLLLEKFPQISQYATNAEMQAVVIFRIVPIVISHLDYSKGFGHTELFKAEELA